MTNSEDGSSYEQVTLPFGVAVEAESSGATNRRFTSYDRSSVTGLDYAVNRHYDPLQGRFTQVDPIGMKSVDLKNPQTLNLYAYCTNDPINHTDPDGLGFFSFFKKLFTGIGKVFSAVGQAIAKVLNNRWVRIGVFVAGFLIGIPAVATLLGKAVTAAVQTALDIYHAIADIASSLQLTGMLFEGKFKELSVSVGLGLVSSAISTIADNVIRGVAGVIGLKQAFPGRDGFFKSFTDILGGAWYGFKQGLRQLFGRGWNSLIPIYGNYCGPGLGSGGDSGLAPVDGIDAVCQTHDRDYNRGRNRLYADRDLVRGLFTAVSRVRIGDIAIAGRPSGGNVYRFLAIPTFGGLITYRAITGNR